MRSAATGVRLLLVAAAVAGLPVLAADAAGPDAAAAVFRVIDAARAAKRLTPPLVRRLAGCTLAPAAEGTTPYFERLAGPCTHAGVASAELRVPTRRTQARDGMLVLEFSPAACIPMESVAQRYGPGEPYLPPPEAPPETPAYLRVIGESERVSFAFTREPPHCLRRVAIDRTVR